MARLIEPCKPPVPWYVVCQGKKPLDKQVIDVVFEEVAVLLLADCERIVTKGKC